MARNEYTTGSSVYVTASFTDPRNGDAPIDPSTVTLEVKAPGGSYAAVSGSSITNTAVGDYEYVLPLAEEGTYRWRWTGTTGDKAKVILGECESVNG